MTKVVLGAALAAAVTLASAAQAHANRIFTVINHSSQRVTQVQISPENANHWGPNLLGVETLKRGATINLSVTQPCLEDVRVTYGNAVKEWRRNANICAPMVLTYTYP
jgi:hypothetical protein